MCTLSRDDTQSPINPAAATAAQDKWKPRPAELPAPPPPRRRPPVHQQSLSRLPRAMHFVRDQHSLFSIIAGSPEPRSAGVEGVLSEGDQCAMSGRKSHMKGKSMYLFRLQIN